MFPLTPDQHHWLDVATEDEGWCSFRSCTPSRSRARTKLPPHNNINRCCTSDSETNGKANNALLTQRCVEDTLITSTQQHQSVLHKRQRDQWQSQQCLAHTEVCWRHAHYLHTTTSISVAPATARPMAKPTMPCSHRGVLKLWDKVYRRHLHHTSINYVIKLL